MKKALFLAVLIVFATLFIRAVEESSWIDNYSVSDLLGRLGSKKPLHYVPKDAKLVEQGKALVEKGQVVLENGQRSKPISKYFICINCHNTVREDPDIRFSNPDTRLPYAIKKGIPFLQASTFWGIVNRESWYNDDYYLKYGDKVKAANDDLREAIQLCAIECAQGRPLEQWEEDAILAYYWDLELKVKDLDLPDQLKNEIRETLNQERVDTSLVAQLKKYYMIAEPASFDKPLLDKKAGYDAEGDVILGEQIYESSCRHCHAEGGVSDFLLDYSRLTFKFLRKNMFKDSDFSIYNIIRKGTYSSPGAVPYMPHYTKEKMSDKQIEGLREFILTQTK